MKRNMNGLMLCGLLLLVFCGRVAAQEAAPGADVEDPRHAELRVLRDTLVAAMNKGDLDAMLALVHPKIIYTPQDGTPLYGPQAIRDYTLKMTQGPNKIVESFSVSPAVDRLADFYGENTALASGSSRDTFKLTNGQTFTLDSRWTASVVKEDGRWLITSLHISGDLFDNPILDMAKGMLVKAVAGGVVVGAMAVGLLGWVLRRRSGAGA